MKKSRYSELEARDCVKTILETVSPRHDAPLLLAFAPALRDSGCKTGTKLPSNIA